MDKCIDYLNKKGESPQLRFNKKVLFELFYFIALEYSYNGRE